LTRYGVPDDEMPDSPPPPPWGPAPFDERDLDAVLSGEPTDIPELRPVADILAALAAAPMPGELRGQTVIMAEFRALAEFRAAGLAQNGRAGDTAQTLVLSGPQERLGRRRAPRHRRRAAPRTSWRAGALISAAAVAAVVLAVVLTGNVPGPFRHLVGPSAVTSSESRQAGGNSSSPKVEVGSASREPTAPPTTGGSAPTQLSEDSSLCHDVYGFIKNQGRGGFRQEMSRLHQLIKLAGGLRQVPTFCAPYVSDLFPNGSLPRIPGSGDQGTESSQAGQDNQLGALAHL
jgi:hypothetical protein